MLMAMRTLGSMFPGFTGFAGGETLHFRVNDIESTFDATMSGLRTLNEGRSVNPGYTSGSQSVQIGMVRAQRRPERQPRLHPARAPSRRPRRRPLNEGRSVNPGYTPRAWGGRR